VRATAGTDLEEAQASVADRPLGHARDAEQARASAERRHVAVIFCDLVDSTGIAAKLDAEE
jgi:class 3 adenylate cyclase